MIIPEIILLNSIKNLLKQIRTDYAANTADPTKSLIYRILGENAIERYGLARQAETVFITNGPRALDVNMFFNAKRAGIPTLHITLPSEAERNNSIAIGEGFHDPEYNLNNEGYARTFNRRFNARYNIIATSDNSLEVVLLYHFLRNCFISLTEHFSLSGLENLKLSGGDIQLNSSLVPEGIFIRSTGLEFEYDVEARTFTFTNVQTFDILGVNAVALDPDVSIS